MTDAMSERGWDYLCPNMRRQRAEKVARYAGEYFEPALERFPELFGKVYLSLRKYGWLAEFDPVLYIVIRESSLDTYSSSRIRATTAHELAHLVQFKNGIGLSRYDTANVERQATFLALGRGFAYDLLRSFPESCDKEHCGRDYKICYYGCGLLFEGCCCDCTDAELRFKADKLTKLAQNYGLSDRPDYFALVTGALKV